MKIYSTTEWGARVVNNARLPRKTAQGVVIHHSAGANRPYWPDDLAYERDKGFQVARDIQRFHRSPRDLGGRGWADTGYHFIVTRGGVVMEGRWGSLELARQGSVLYGAHSGVKEINASHWGVLLEGSYMLDLPPAAQWRAAVELCAHLSLWGGTQARAITGHRDHKATLCPGDRLYGRLEQLRDETRTRKLALMGVK